MYSCVHLENSYIRIGNIDYDNLWGFIEDLNELEYFKNFFYNFGQDYEINQNKSYELTYHNDGDLDYNQILNLITTIVQICKRYQNFLNLTIKIFDDGLFLMYIMVINNEIFDITDKINNSLIRAENIIINSIE